MVPVVVCGGGPVGLLLALELAAWQVPVVLVERHRSPSPFPRGRAISTRSMEILRQLIDARFGTEVIDAQQRADHVEVRLGGSGGPDTTVRTAWLVGADGSRSRVRHLAGIGTDTPGASCSNVNILIDADLEPLVGDRTSMLYAISNDDLHATVLTVDNRRRWLLNVVAPDGEQVDPTPQWCERMVRAAVGRDDGEVTPRPSDGLVLGGTYRSAAVHAERACGLA